MAIYVFWSGIFSDLLAGLEQATTFHYKQVVVQHIQQRVYMNISPVEPETNWDLRRSFKKCVCITDDLLEEMTNQICPALQCTSLMSVQLGWLLCFEWQECTHRQEEPDSPAVAHGFWRTQFFVFLKDHAFSTACLCKWSKGFVCLFKDCSTHLMPSMNPKFYHVVSETQTYWSPIKTEFTCSNQNASKHNHDFHTRKSLFTLMWMVHRWFSVEKVRSLCVNLISSFWHPPE